MSDGVNGPQSWIQMAPNAFLWESGTKKLPEFTVVKLGVEPHSASSGSVRDQLFNTFGNRVGFITVEVREIDHRLEATRTWILMWRKQLGWQPSMHTPTGFYLFSGLVVLAFADGVPSKNERETAFLETATRRDPTFSEFELIADRHAADRVVSVFKEAADAFDSKRGAEEEAKARTEREAAESKERQARDLNEKFRRMLAAMKRPLLTQRDRDAIKLLGVAEDYTLAELTAAKRAAQKRVHPDVSNLSPAESHKRSAACNAAFDLLRARIH